MKAMNNKCLIYLKNYKMLVNIRDDDTNYYTSPDDLKQAYGEFLGKIPITIAVIPFVSEFYFRMLK